MNICRTVFASVFVFALALGGAPTSVSHAKAESAAEANATTTAQAFIEGLAQEAVAALTTEGVSHDDRILRFTDLLDANFDVETIGKWVLGRYWRGASPEEKAEYLKLFREYIVITYVERFDQYSGERLKVIKSVSEPGEDALVFSEIRRPTGGEPIRVDWRVRAEADVYKILDVYVEGISMSQTQRKEFTSVIRANGGTVAGLNNALRTLIAKLSN